MKKDKVLEMLRAFFVEHEWKYRFDSEKMLLESGVSMESVIGKLQLAILLRERHYKVIAILANQSDEEHIKDVAEYLHRANYGLDKGNFELDYEDGEIRYKMLVDFHGIELSKRVIEESILIPILMFEKYGCGLIKMMVGSGNPKMMIDEVEREKADQ